MELRRGLGGSLILGRIGGVSPFLRKVTTASGATAVQVVAKEGRQNKILEHLGSAHTEAELAALMKAGRDKINAGQEVLDLGLERDPQAAVVRSEEHTSELQSRGHLVCRLQLDKKTGVKYRRR